MTTKTTTRPEATEPEFVEEKPNGTKVYRHPSYGSVRVTRVSGGAKLHGSPIPVMDYISLSIFPAEVEVAGSGVRRSRPDTGRGHITVNMTSEQFARLQHSIGLFHGVDCTITRLNGVGVPEEVHEKPSASSFRARIAEVREQLRVSLHDATAELADGVGKRRGKEIQNNILRETERLLSNLEYVENEFDDHVQAVSEHVMHEMSAFGQRVSQDAMANQHTQQGITDRMRSVLALPAATDDDDVSDM